MDCMKTVFRASIEGMSFAQFQPGIFFTSRSWAMGGRWSAIPRGSFYYTFSESVLQPVKSRGWRTQRSSSGSVNF